MIWFDLLADSAVVEVEVAEEDVTICSHSMEVEVLIMAPLFLEQMRTVAVKLYLVLMASPTKASPDSDVNFWGTIAISVSTVRARVWF